jgi:hypothetical protein
MASNGKLKTSQYKNSISRLGSLHETSGEMGDRTQTIILGSSDIHFDNIYQGILSIEKHPWDRFVDLNKEGFLVHLID